ncbi:MAG TPA: hypothetical protein VMS35_01825 [Nitrososphaeraceae archaeon]|nr:hypothetical protein [Nitrososphaeraceae archaeon]
MTYKKIRTFSIFLLLGIAALFVPVTALQNSIAMAQQYYPEYEENEYYNQEYDPYQNDEKNPPIVNVEKKLFVCNNVTDSPNDYQCEGTRILIENGDDDFVISYPSTPDSGDYIPCNDEICPFIDESDFGVQIFKDVATVRELSPEGTTVNLDKLHYTVTELFINDRIPTNDQCSLVGFTHNLFPEKITNDSIIFNGICVNYVGDCEGTIYPGEVKTCTVENYIYERHFDPIQTVG